MNLYSATTKGWYMRGVHSDIPADAIEVSQETKKELLRKEASGFVIGTDSSGCPVAIQQQSAPLTADDLCQLVDAAADTARNQVVGDPLRGEEYKLAAAEAATFAAAGYPAAEVPRTVAAWVSATRTPQQAADHILVEAAQYNEALYLLRETRLQAKELVRQAMAAGQVEQAQDIAAETIASIEAAVAGIGNNA